MSRFAPVSVMGLFLLRVVTFDLAAKGFLSLLLSRGQRLKAERFGFDFY